MGQTHTLSAASTAFFNKLITDLPRKEPEISLSLIRENTIHLCKAAGGKIPALKKRSFKASDGYEVPYYLFNEDSASTDLMIFFPGTGYCVPKTEYDLPDVARIAAASKCKIAVIEHRVCPEASMPTPIQDCLEAIQYFQSQAESFGISANDIVLSGFSSGAHAALSVALLMIKQKMPPPKSIILLNGFYTTHDFPTAYKAYEQCDPLCPRGAAPFIFAQYGISEEACRNDSRYSPLDSPLLKDLPPVHILVGEFDGLRSDSEALYDNLKTTGTKVSKQVLAGQTHNAFSFRHSFQEGKDPAQHIAEILNAHSPID